MKQVWVGFWLGFLLASSVPLSAQESLPTPPRWDARGLGALPRQGIASLDVSDDGTEIVVGTIAAPGDPNVIVLNAAGKIVRHYKVGQRWINQVAFIAGSQEVLAICTMPAGKAGDRPEVFRLSGDAVIAEKIKQDTPVFFHYGDHSNHATMLLARAQKATALLAGNQLIVYRNGKEPVTLRLPVNDPDASVSLAVDETGWSVVGTTGRANGNNLYLFDPEKKNPVWVRPVNQEVDKAPALEKGLYGMPTLPDGTRAELLQRDEKVWAPLSVAFHSDGAKKLIAVADYQGWQRWVRSSATMKEENQGLRFMPAKPAITVYDHTGKVVMRYALAKFESAFWCDLRFSPSIGNKLFAWTHSWKCRGLAGQTMLPADDDADKVYMLETATFAGAAGHVKTLSTGHTVYDLALSARSLVVGHDKGLWGDGIPQDFPKFDAPCLVRFHPKETQFFVGATNGIVASFDARGKKLWQTDLNKDVPKALKPWVANARATPIVPGVWQLPGGRVESDLGGQRLIEAPDGYILIEGHAGLSFEREWAAIEAVGLDPKKVKYVLATHEHGDHAPGAYLWRVVTGAQFVCSEEMAYTLQHHIPLNTGYGLHPPVPTDIRIKEDTDLNLAGLKVRAIRIPGHTYGSMAWHFEKSGKTFVAFGDLIMPRGVLGYSGSVNFSARDVLSSLRKLNALKPDYVLPGHGAVEGPANYFAAGIDVGQAVGWGFIKPEHPDPRFRITQKNVVVVGWGQGATSAAFGDLNGDGKPDVVMVAPDGAGSIVKIFLNHGGKFNDEPDQEIKIPTVSQPHKVRVHGGYILVAGKSAALLIVHGSAGKEKVSPYKIIPFDLADGNHLRPFRESTERDMVLVSRRFGGFYALTFRDKTVLRKFEPDIDGPYVDFYVTQDNGLLTSYGQFYHPGAKGKYKKTPTFQLPHEKDWTFLAVGGFKGFKSVSEDAVLLSYGMDKSTTARVFYGTGKPERPFADKADTVISLTELLTTAKKGQAPPLVRDTPVVADWDRDGFDDLIVAHGQSNEVLILLGSKDGLSKERVQRIQLEYRVHYEHGAYVGDFNGDGKMDLAVFGYTNTGVGASGPPAVYLWLQ